MLYDIAVTPAQLKAAADWCQNIEHAAAVELVADDRMLLVEQGDDRAAFDTGGEPGSDDYLAVAPLDPRENRYGELLDRLKTIAGRGSAADQCAALYELLGEHGIRVP